MQLHHPYAFTIRAYPGRSITDAPFVFFKTFLTDHKPAGTAPTKFLILFAAVTNIFTNLSFSVTSFFRLRHF